MPGKFQGKRALVTGAGRGIGRALVQELVKEGASVIALSLTQKNLDSLQKECPSIETVSVNVKNWKETEQAIKKLGAVDLLVNNAGILSLQPIGEITEEEIEDCFAVNVKGLINISQVVAMGMKERGKGGSIVNISSQAAMIGLPKHTTYCASKGAVDQVTKCMALELAPYQIRVNSVNPTIVTTDMGVSAIESYGNREVVEAALKQKVPLGRFCDANDVVKFVLFVLSDDAKMITGSSLLIDGGYTAQ